MTKISELKGLGFRYGEHLKKKVLEKLDNEVFWEKFTSLNEYKNILKEFNLKNCKLYIEIKEEPIENILRNSLLSKKEFITFSKEEYEKSENCLSMPFNDLFNKFSSKEFIELFFNEKKEEFFFSEITKLDNNPIISLFIILYLEDISLFATPSQLFDKEEKERSYKAVKDSIKTIKKQINLIISTDLYCPSYLFEIKLEKGIYDLNKLHNKHSLNYFQRDLLIMENYLFKNIIIIEELYLQDYVFCFNECITWEDLIVLLAVETINYPNAIFIRTKTENLIKPKYFDKFVDLQKTNEEIKDIGIDVNDFLFAYMLVNYEREILKNTDFDVSFQKTLIKKNLTYTNKMIKSAEDLLTKKDIYKKFYQHLFVKKGGLNVIDDFESIILKNSKQINVDTFKKELIRKFQNKEIFLKSSNFFKKLILQKLGEKVEDIFYEDEALFEEFIEVIFGINLDVEFSPNLDKNIAKFRDPWRTNLKEKIEQFFKNNTKSLFHNDFERFFKLESELNEEIAEKIVKEKLYPTNKDVYSFLKATVIGDEKHIKSEELRRLFKNKKDYKKIVILVFDGLGLALLKWGSYQKDFKTLKKLLDNENNFSIIQSNLPSFTGVNHTAMLSDKEIFEDVFFKREYEDEKQSCTFEKIKDDRGKYTKFYRSYRIQGEGDDLFTSVSDLFSYNTDEWLGVTKHVTKNSFLSKIIFNSINQENLTKAPKYITAMKKALSSKKELTISQVNIFDEFMDKYDDAKRAVEKLELDDYYDFFIDLLRNINAHINNNIQKDTLVIITSDHGLTWIKSDNIIRLPNPKMKGVEIFKGQHFLRELNEELDSKIVLWKKEGYEPAYIRIDTKNQTPATLFYPTYGPRRVASFYITNPNFKADLLQALEKINNGRYKIKVNKEPREFDPDITLLCKNHVFNSNLYPNKFFVGLHGGISVHELFVPLIVFDEETWTECKK